MKKDVLPLAQIQDLIELILNEIAGLSKPQLKFVDWIFIAWLGFPVQRNMTNLARFSPYCEKTIRSAFSLNAVQTLCLKELEAKGKDLMTHYISIIQDQGSRLKKLGITYVAADAYFCKRTFMIAMVKMELHLIMRARPDADLKYLCILQTEGVYCLYAKQKDRRACDLDVQRYQFGTGKDIGLLQVAFSNRVSHPRRRAGGMSSQEQREIEFSLQYGSICSQHQ